MPPKEPKSRKRIFWEYAEALVTALILALIIRAYVVQAFKIPSGSMEPTLLVGDHILVNKFIYGTRIPLTEKRTLIFKKPHRGDIIVFKYPEDPERDFVKRVIAVEGDVIESMDKRIYINGELFEEPFVRHSDPNIKRNRNQPRDNFGPIVVPKNKYFVMGDNRDHSYDSRYWGFVDINSIKGKSFILYWSWNKQKSWPRFKRIGRVVR